MKYEVVAIGDVIEFAHGDLTGEACEQGVVIAYDRVYNKTGRAQTKIHLYKLGSQYPQERNYQVILNNDNLILDAEGATLIPAHKAEHSWKAMMVHALLWRGSNAGLIALRVWPSHIAHWLNLAAKNSKIAKTWTNDIWAKEDNGVFTFFDKKDEICSVSKTDISNMLVNKFPSKKENIRHLSLIETYLATDKLSDFRTYFSILVDDSSDKIKSLEKPTDEGQELYLIEPRFSKETNVGKTKPSELVNAILEPLSVPINIISLAEAGARACIVQLSESSLKNVLGHPNIVSIQKLL